ncbi:MAG: hypothetical protein M1827_004292 [Pycnora praestabilis]|nr:MAG: hypothetical protein M1827_004292 [Pycnora praestabilis]
MSQTEDSDLSDSSPSSSSEDSVASSSITAEDWVATELFETTSMASTALARPPPCKSSLTSAVKLLLASQHIQSSWDTSALDFWAIRPVFPFLKLPQDIRHIIYELLLRVPSKAITLTKIHRSPGIYSLGKRLIRFKRVTLSYLLVNRQVYGEAIRVFFARNNFAFNYSGFAATLGRMSGLAPSYITEITFSLGGYFRSDLEDAIPLFEKMKNLRRFHFLVDDGVLLRVLREYGSQRIFLHKVPGLVSLRRIRGMFSFDVQWIQDRGMVDDSAFEHDLHEKQRLVIEGWLKETMLKPREVEGGIHTDSGSECAEGNEAFIELADSQRFGKRRKPLRGEVQLDWM